MCPIKSKEISDWVEKPQVLTYSKVYYSETLKTSKWWGYPDPNYAWEGERLVWERVVKDEEGKDVTVKTYKDPIEIIADFKTESKVFGVEGDIEKAAVKKFGGALKGFIWLDNIIGGGEVVLPFTAPHIFIATGDRLNPKLTEIGTDPNSDNWYEIIEGKTHVVVKSFSGIGGAAGKPPELIAHYKMNENTAGDNAELVVGGNFTSWAGDDDPVGWTVVDEVGSNPMVNEVGAGQGQGGIGTGYCNIYSSTSAHAYIQQNITLVVGRKYRFSINVDTLTVNELRILDDSGNSQFTGISYNSTGTKTFTFVAVHTDLTLLLRRANSSACDLTFDDVSIKLLAVEDSSGNDHDGLAQQDTDQISAANTRGVGTCFDFNGSSDYIAIADHDDFDVSTISISIWVFPDSLETVYLVSKLDDLNSEASYGVYIYGGVGQFVLSVSTNGTFLQNLFSSEGLITAGEWNHVVVTYKEGVGVKFYVNGVFDILDATETGALYTGTGRVTIGARYDSSQSIYKLFFDGLIDNVMFFGRELDQHDIDFLWNGGNGREDWVGIVDRRFRSRSRIR